MVISTNELNNFCYHLGNDEKEKKIIISDTFFIVFIRVNNSYLCNK
jgi:hypothetical protein